MNNTMKYLMLHHRFDPNTKFAKYFSGPETPITEALKLIMEKCRHLQDIATYFSWVIVAILFLRCYRFCL